MPWAPPVIMIDFPASLLMILFLLLVVSKARLCKRLQEEG
jgi:hypothetical protein